MAEADAMIFIFPLYVFCLAGAVDALFAGLQGLRGRATRKPAGT